MEEFTTGPISFSWDPDSRIAFLSFSRPTIAVGQYADELIAAMTRWIGDENLPFGLLGDGRNLSFPDAEYRNKWGTFLKQHKNEAYLAFFNMDSNIRLLAEFFGTLFGLHLKTFNDKNSAISWLSSKISVHQVSP